MKPAGLLLVLIGVWGLCQVLGGDALGRTGVLTALGAQDNTDPGNGLNLTIPPGLDPRLPRSNVPGVQIDPTNHHGTTNAQPGNRGRHNADGGTGFLGSLPQNPGQPPVPTGLPPVTMLPGASR